MSGMTPKREIGVALALGSIACFVIWVVYLIPLMPPTSSDKWPLYLLFFTLPLPQVFRVYRYIRKGMQPEKVARSMGYNIFSGLPNAIISAYLLIKGLHHRRDTFIFPLIYTLAGMYLVLSIQFFWRAIKAPRGQAPLAKSS